jgi:hypothetical protein
MTGDVAKGQAGDRTMSKDRQGTMTGEASRGGTGQGTDKQAMTGGITGLFFGYLIKDRL